MANAKVQVCRAYEDPAQGDGTRVLAGRSWREGYGQRPGVRLRKQAQPELVASDHLPEHAWGRCQASEVSWRFSCHL